jgi:hypothetical protein
VNPFHQIYWSEKVSLSGSRCRAPDIDPGYSAGLTQNDSAAGGCLLVGVMPDFYSRNVGYSVIHRPKKKAFPALPRRLDIIPPLFPVSVIADPSGPLLLPLIRAHCLMVSGDYNDKEFCLPCQWPKGHDSLWYWQFGAGDGTRTRDSLLGRHRFDLRAPQLQNQI